MGCAKVAVFIALVLVNLVAKVDGKTAQVLRNNQGLEAHILPLGAVVQKLLLPDRYGRFEDVVLGFDTEEPYKNGVSPYFGAVVGRVANRLKGAQFELDGQTFHVSANEGANSLHGGKDGWSRQAWQVAEVSETPAGPAVRLTLTARDQGYPGVVQASVTYTLRHDNELVVEMAARSDAATPINMAQHTYFNLDGHNSHHSINGHFMTLNASYYTPVHNDMIPTGEMMPVEGTAFDFRKAHRVGERIRHVPGPAPGGYDINYVLWGLDGPAMKARTKDCALFDKPQEALSIWSPRSGRMLHLLTTAPGLQFYTGNYLNGSIVGKGGFAYEQHGGFALEAQVFPNSINQPNFPQCVLRPGQQYQSTTVWRFRTAPRNTTMRRRFKRVAITKQGRKELPN